MTTLTQEPECVHQELIDACIKLSDETATHCALDVMRQCGYATKSEEEFNSVVERIREQSLSMDRTPLEKQRTQLVCRWKRVGKVSHASGLLYADEMPNLAREYKDASMRKAWRVVKGLECEERRRITAVERAMVPDTIQPLCFLILDRNTKYGDAYYFIPKPHTLEDGLRIIDVFSGLKEEENWREAARLIYVMHENLIETEIYKKHFGSLLLDSVENTGSVDHYDAMLYTQLVCIDTTELDMGDM
jgi:hypothetical protein